MMGPSLERSSSEYVSLTSSMKYPQPIAFPPAPLTILPADLDPRLAGPSDAPAVPPSTAAHTVAGPVVSGPAIAASGAAAAPGAAATPVKPRRTRNRWLPAEVDTVCRMRRNGASFREIAEVRLRRSS